MLQGIFAGLFGPSHNDRFAELMIALADKTVECAKHFNKTDGQDLQGVIAYEREGDALVDQIHEILDNSFIMRFDIADAMRLADELDNVLDGLRKTAMHIDIYKKLLTQQNTDAKELFVVTERIITRLRDVVAMLKEPRLKLPKVRELATEIDEFESDADRIVALAERRLVGEYSPPGANRLEFLAWNRLYNLLEEATDHANHCAKLVLSLARKEA
jgi:uncharacterized protein Yka (UPF0111/DUF47 family)